MNAVDLFARRSVETALRQARSSILKLATELSGLPDLTPAERGQIRALATIAGIVPHQVLHAEGPDSADVDCFVENTQAVARAADELIDGIGFQVKQELRFRPKGGIDLSKFRGRVRAALEPAIAEIKRACGG